MDWVLVAVIVFTNAFGDTLTTLGMKRRGQVEDLRPAAISRVVAEIALNRYVIGGIAMLAVGFFALMALLSFADLSFAIPATAASYVIEMVLGRTVLHERVDWVRWAGVWLVACGVALIAL